MHDSKHTQKNVGKCSRITLVLDDSCLGRERQCVGSPYYYALGGHKGPVSKPRCIGPGRARTHIFYFRPWEVGADNSGLSE